MAIVISKLHPMFVGEVAGADLSKRMNEVTFGEIGRRWMSTPCSSSTELRWPRRRRSRSPCGSDRLNR